MMAHAAHNLIDALKGNFAKAHDKTELDALDRLANFFVSASKQVRGVECEEVGT